MSVIDRHIRPNWSAVFATALTLSIVLLAVAIPYLMTSFARDYIGSQLTSEAPSDESTETATAGASVPPNDLAGVDFSDTDLAGKDLRNINLTSANLAGANLADADLRGANLSSATLAGANLDGANLNGAIADARTVWPEDFDPDARGVELIIP